MSRFIPTLTLRRQLGRAGAFPGTAALMGAAALVGAASFVGAAALSWSTSAVAGEKRGHEFPISIAEARAAFDARFDALDTDGDGVISRSEFLEAPAMARHGGAWGHHGKRAPGMKGHGREGGERAGGRREGRTSEAREAWQAKRAQRHAEVFERLDTDGDGQLSEEEFGNREMPESRRAMMRERMFDRLDQDGSGTLSRDELGVWLERLEAMDADGDGLVTREEARAHHRARRGTAEG